MRKLKLWGFHFAVNTKAGPSGIYEAFRSLYEIFVVEKRFRT